MRRLKMLFDRLKYDDAMGQFAMMLVIGEELEDHDIIALALMYQGDILRKRGLYETAVKRMNTAQNHAKAARMCVQGMLWCIYARAHAAYGQSELFAEAIDKAQDAVLEMEHDFKHAFP